MYTDHHNNTHQQSSAIQHHRECEEQDGHLVWSDRQDCSSRLISSIRN